VDSRLRPPATPEAQQWRAGGNDGEGNGNDKKKRIKYIDSRLGSAIRQAHDGE